MMNGEQTFNVNSAECLKSETGFTETVIHNVCSGDTQKVPHGGADIIAGGTLLMFFAVGVLFLLVAGFKTLFD